MSKLPKGAAKKAIEAAKERGIEIEIHDVPNLYFPGAKDVCDELMKNERFITIKEIGTNTEDIWYFNGQIYERAEEHIRTAAHTLFLEKWGDVLIQLETVSKDKRNEFTQKLYGRLNNALHTGPKESQIREVLAMIRRTTFADADEMNPPGNIPFLNGLLEIDSRKLVPFSSNLFYTYQIDAKYLEQTVTLQDTPLFSAQLNQVFYPWDIPMVLSYFAYCLHPELPVHKVLGIFGRERVGKGTLGRVLKGLLRRGFGSFSLARLLTAERFQFTGIEGKNVLVDFEVKRKFKRGTVKSWSDFNNLFGQDTLSVEKKTKEAQDRISKAKGVIIGNLPFFSVDDSAAIERWLPVVTKGEKPGRTKPNIDAEIVRKERDKIATLLVHILFGLMDRGWIFPGQLTAESTQALMELLADPVENFVDECTESLDGATVEVNKAYAAFETWCVVHGITPISSQTFKRRFGQTYPKRRYKHGKGNGYEFVDCVLLNDKDLDDAEKGTESQTKLQVGAGSKTLEALKNGFRGNGYRRFQHVHPLPRMGVDNKEPENNKRDHAHKLEPVKSASEKPENKPLRGIKDRSNLQNDPVHEENEVKYEGAKEPVKNFDVSHVPSGFSKEMAERVITELLQHGYHVDIDHGFSIGKNSKSYHIRILKTSTSGRFDDLEERMASHGFYFVNYQERFGYLFGREISRADEE